MAFKLAVDIIADASSLERQLRRASKGVNRFQKDIGKTGKSGTGAFRGLSKGLGLVTGALGVAGLAGAARAAFTEMGDAQKVSAQTAAAIKSTGGAAHVSAKQVDELATAMLNKTGIDDEAIKSGENLLLTFTNIRNEAGKGNDVFSQATKTITDMSVALGQDMKSSAIQVGKALQDPIKGITALRRVGVSFTEAQKDQIKALVATGHTMEAQKLILHELNREFGGSAEAAGKTLPGQLNKLKETLLNLGGSIAQTLAPTIQKLLESMTKWLSNSKNQKQILDIVNTAVGALTAVVKVLKGAFDTLSTIVGGNKRAIELLIGAYVVFQGLKMASTISTMAGSFGLLTKQTRATTVATEGATVASGGMTASLLGKAGLAPAVIYTGYQLSKLIRKIPGWDSAFKGFGGTVEGVAASLGLIHDPGKQFEGKTNPTQANIRFLRNQARRLEAGGMTPAQAAARLAQTHPNVARRDIEVAAGVRGKAPLVINGGLHLHGVQNVAQLEQELQKRTKQRQQPRRGPH